jgi:hypothetical protein
VNHGDDELLEQLEKKSAPHPLSMFFPAFDADP